MCPLGCVPYIADGLVTVTMAVHMEVFPAVSLAVKVTVVTPALSVVPAVGDCVTMTAPVQLSVV